MSTVEVSGWRRRMGGLLLAAGLLLAGRPVGAAEAPEVRVVTPPPPGVFVLPGDGPTLLVAVEIVDRDGSGLETDDAGVPRFVDADENVRLFRDNVVGTCSYTRPDGYAVTQIVSKVPIGGLVHRADARITGPFDTRNLTEAQKADGWSVPPEMVVEFASLRFVVKSRSGLVSSGETAWPAPAYLSVGFSDRLFVPPAD